VTVDIRSFPRPDWSPLPYEGCFGVDGKVLVSEDGFLIAMLRFEPQATIHEHPGDNDTVVMCVEGAGFTSVAGEVAPVRAGQQIRWPKGITHRLWTNGSPMVTLMYERTDGS
jgi:quercetin dioxygenase-like cupin family protein